MARELNETSILIVQLLALDQAPHYVCWGFQNSYQPHRITAVRLEATESISPHWAIQDAVLSMGLDAAALP
jgi:hypothetical protein